MLGSEGFQSDREFYACRAVYVCEHIVFKLDDVALFLCDQRGYRCKLARLIRKHNAYGEDTVSLHKAVLDNRSHCENVHISAT